MRATSNPPPEEVLISLGSNVEPERNLPAAIAMLRERLDVTAVSRVFDTPAVGGSPESRFRNVAVALLTGLEPSALKHEVLRRIEADLGRVRTSNRNAPRTIDLDIVLFGERIVSEGEIVIPDPDILRHAHVAVPLADVAPRRRHPVTGETLDSIATRLATGAGIRALD